MLRPAASAIARNNWSAVASRTWKEIRRSSEIPASARACSSTAKSSFHCAANCRRSAPTGFSVTVSVNRFHANGSREDEGDFVSSAAGRGDSIRS